jgi:hypothetical protein
MTASSHLCQLFSLIAQSGTGDLLLLVPAASATGNMLDLGRARPTNDTTIADWTASVRAHVPSISEQNGAAYTATAVEVGGHFVEDIRTVNELRWRSALSSVPAQGGHAEPAGEGWIGLMKRFLSESVDSRHEFPDAEPQPQAAIVAAPNGGGGVPGVPNRRWRLSFSDSSLFTTHRIVQGEIMQGDLLASHFKLKDQEDWFVGEVVEKTANHADVQFHDGMQWVLTSSKSRGHTWNKVECL